MSSKGLKVDLKLCPGLLLPALMKDEECEGTSDIFLQKSMQKKAKHFFSVKESVANCCLLLLSEPKCTGGELVT